MVVKDSLITAQNGTRGRFEDTNRYFLDLIVGENEPVELVFAHYHELNAISSSLRSAPFCIRIQRLFHRSQ